MNLEKVNSGDITSTKTVPPSAGSHILLMMLPFWPPQIPPMGISCLKSYLVPRGCRVTAIDLNTDNRLRGFYYNYFETLGKYIPPEMRGNFYGIGTDVLKNHLMAHINPPLDQEERYIELVKILIEKTYYLTVEEAAIRELNRILTDYYANLEDYLVRLLERLRPAVLALSVTSGTLASSLFAFRIAKKMNPVIKTVMGGGVFSDHLAPGSPNLEDFLEKTKDIIDHLVIGEGEILFFKLLAREFPPSKRVLTLKDINGQLLDLSTVDIPDFTDFDIGAYPYSSGYASRSCPYQCGFCSETVLWGKYRKKDVTQTVREFERLFQRDGTQLFSLSDSLLNPVITELAREFIKSRYAIYWDACLRAGAQSCQPENVHLWRRGGFYKAWLGLESGSQRVLNLMNKQLTLAQARETVTNLANAGIKTATLWLIGYPGETEADFQQTLDLLEELTDDIYDAEGTPFWYFLQGQSNSAKWRNTPSRLLYPEDAADMLILQTWVLESEPSRKEIYERHRRFIRHLNRLGIPNPYTLEEMYEADERWKKLHPNAVPGIIEFDPSTYIDECKQVEEVFRLPDLDLQQEEGDFCF